MQSDQPNTTDDRFFLTILESLGWHQRGRLKKALLLRRQLLQLEIASREGEIKGLQAAIEFSKECADAK